MSESPRHGEVAKLKRRASSVRELLVRTRNRTATAQAAIASVSSQESINCHAGSVNR